MEYQTWVVAGDLERWCSHQSHNHARRSPHASRRDSSRCSARRLPSRGALESVQHAHDLPVANLEDLAAIAGSFEAATQPLIDELPGCDNGVYVIGGTTIDMVTRVEVPLLA